MLIRMEVGGGWVKQVMRIRGVLVLMNTRYFMVVSNYYIVQLKLIESSIGVNKDILGNLRKQS